MGLMYVSQNSPEGRATTCGHCAVPILEGNDLYGVDKDYCCLPRLSHTKTALQFGFWKAASRHFVLQVATLRSVKGHVPAILSSSRASWLYRDVDTTAECGIVSISSPSFPVSPPWGKPRLPRRAYCRSTYRNVEADEYGAVSTRAGGDESSRKEKPPTPSALAAESPGVHTYLVFRPRPTLSHHNSSRQLYP
jgi:hypothetical protein